MTAARGDGPAAPAPDPAAEVEAALREGVGPLPPDADLVVAVTSRAGILFRVRATLRRPGSAARSLDVEVPLEGRRQFARALGRSLAGPPGPAAADAPAGPVST